MALDHAKAQGAVKRLLDRLPERSEEYRMAQRVFRMLEPPMTMSEILQRIPAPTLRERAKLLGISRQGYYNLCAGISIPSSNTRARLSDLTGVPVEQIKEIRRHG